MRNRIRHAGMASVAALIFLAGCEGESRVLTRPGNGQGQAQADDEGSPAARGGKIKLRPVIGKTTQDIRAAEPELRNGGAKIATMKVTAKDPITLQGNVYVTSIGRISVMKIQHALDLYYATNEKYPKDLKEFMEEIIQPNGIRLPTLPYYQEYAYDEKEHKLVILEYPDRKAQFQEQQDKELGRR